jgi:hypothetical protein
LISITFRDDLIRALARGILKESSFAASWTLRIINVA